MSEPHTRGRPGAILRFALAVLGVLSPAGVFPLTRSCIPLACMLGGLSLTCLALLPTLWRYVRNPAWKPAPWPEGSPKEQRFKKLGQRIRATGLVFFLVSLAFVQSWHPHQMNWQQIIATPGYLSLLWAALIETYAAKRRTDAPKSGGSWTNASPIQSRLWGSR